MFKPLIKGVILVTVGLSLVSCGGRSGKRTGGLFSKLKVSEARKNSPDALDPLGSQRSRFEGDSGGVKRKTIWDAFISPDKNINVRVNKYLWNAALETMNFLPVESADPFTGVLVMGYGRAPGGSRAYRATVLVQDPALDARSLKLSIHTRGGPASAETVRRIEDAIMTRARQLRIRDKNL